MQAPLTLSGCARILHILREVPQPQQLPRESGGTGRRAGFRILWDNPWGFDSPLSHQEPSVRSLVINDVKVSIKENSTWQRALELEIPRARVEREEKRFLGLYRKKAKLDGFRPGKAPDHLILQRYRTDIRSEAVEAVLPEVITEVLEEHRIEPLTPPRVFDIQYGDEGPLRVKATVEVIPEFEVKGWKGLKLEKPVRQIKDQDVEEALDALRERTAELVSVERPAALGDFLVADLTECDEGGTPLIGKRSPNRLLYVAGQGESEAIGRQLLGLSKGEDRRVVIEHAAGSGDAAAHGGGHRHVYLVSVNEVKEKKLPVLDDEYARGLGEFEDLAHLRRMVHEDLERQVEGESRRQMMGQVIDQLIQKNRLEIPESLINSYLDGVVEEHKKSAQGEAVDENLVRQQYRGLAQVQIQWQMLFNRLAEQEGITVGDEEVRVQVDAIAERNQLKAADLWKAFEARGRLASIRADLLEAKVADHILDAAKVRERVVEPGRGQLEPESAAVAEDMMGGGKDGEPGGEGPAGGSRLIIPGR
jgi:trigger factor